MVIAFIGVYDIGYNKHKLDAGNRAINMKQSTYNNKDIRYIIFGNYE
jgi:hypothetical protein